MSPETLEILQDSINEVTNKISKIITTVTENQVASYFNWDIPQLDKYVQTSYDKLMKYSESTGMRKEFSQRVKRILDKAAEWSKQVKSRYNKLELS